jgi:hypothetical protein
VFKKPHRQGGHSLCWAAEPEKIKINNSSLVIEILYLVKCDLNNDVLLPGGFSKLKQMIQLQFAVLQSPISRPKYQLSLLLCFFVMY